jgi:hypothetical protein
VTSTPSSVTRWKIFPPNCSNFFTICRTNRRQQQQQQQEGQPSGSVSSACQRISAHCRQLGP